MTYFYFEGKKIHYTEQGSGTPLLLLHGNAASSMMFYQIAAEFAVNHRVVLMDFLGHGQSERLDVFPTDLWYFEAQQVLAFLKEKQYGKANLIGTSGGALVAINVALEAPELLDKIIADSFEGTSPLAGYINNLKTERAASKLDEQSQLFYYYMHGEDWQQVVDQDTAAVLKHAQEIGTFFHQPLSALQTEFLLTGSREDEYYCREDAQFLDHIYKEILHQAGHGQSHLFETGSHPAMLSNQEEFCRLSKQFLAQ